MIIGIDGSRAFLARRTGIEEYAYQVIRHLCTELSVDDVRVVLYIRADQEVDFDVPLNWRVKKLWAPRLWTHVRLSLEMLLHRPDALFIPAHTVPLIHPRQTVVVVHGLEYEICPEAYSWLSRLLMRWAIKFSCRVASRVVCVSENTKRDVERLYGVAREKLQVVSNGYQATDNLQLITHNQQPTTDNSQPTTHNTQRTVTNNKLFGIPDQVRDDKEKQSQKTAFPKQETGDQEFFKSTCGTPHSTEKLLEHTFLRQCPYFLFIGRIEERKNVARLIEAFTIAKKKHTLPHKLVLIGKPGFGYEKVRETIDQSASREDILELGYVTDEEKWQWLIGASAFCFATLYEGFGIPVLEAQSVGVPVVTSNTSSLPEVAGESALLVDPIDTTVLAEALFQLATDEKLRSEFVVKGYENVKRFSWYQCARELAVLLQKE